MLFESEVHGVNFKVYAVHPRSLDFARDDVKSRSVGNEVGRGNPICWEEMRVAVRYGSPTCNKVIYWIIMVRRGAQPCALTSRG